MFYHTIIISLILFGCFVVSIMRAAEVEFLPLPSSTSNFLPTSVTQYKSEVKCVIILEFIIYFFTLSGVFIVYLMKCGYITKNMKIPSIIYLVSSVLIFGLGVWNILFYTREQDLATVAAISVMFLAKHWKQYSFALGILELCLALCLLITGALYFLRGSGRRSRHDDDFD